jgi:hypothetical protein
VSHQQRILFWDVETAPALAFAFQAKTDWIPSHMFQHETFLLTWAAKWAGSNRVISERLTGAEARAQDDSRLVTSLVELIREADVIVAHNGDGFDEKVLRGRAMLTGSEPLGPVRSVDTLKLAKRSFRLTHNSLNHLAKHLGVPQKMDTGGFSLWRDAYLGDEKALAKMDRYCRADVRCLEGVYGAMLPHVKGLPRLIDASHDGEDVCPYCGSAERQSRGLTHTNASSFPRYRCSCGRWYRGRQAVKSRLANVPLT